MRKILVGLLLLFALALVASATTTKTSRHSKSSKPASADSTVDADTRLCRDAARALITGYGRELKTKISSSMKKGGLLRAITVCGDSARAIAESRSSGGWTIRRISSKNLDAAGMSDSTQQAVLAAFQQVRKTRPTFKDLWTTSGNTRTYHFYEPIIAQDFCLRCHGGKETVDQSVADSISSHYPNKPTFGFTPGELIGLFVVEASWPDGQARALELTGRAGH